MPYFFFQISRGWEVKSAGILEADAGRQSGVKDVPSFDNIGSEKSSSQLHRKLIHVRQEGRDQICGSYSEIKPWIEQASGRHLRINTWICCRLVASYGHVGGSCQFIHFGSRAPKNTSVMEKISKPLENTQNNSRNLWWGRHWHMWQHGLLAYVILFSRWKRLTYNCVVIFPVLCKLFESKYLVFLSINSSTQHSVWHIK